MSGQFRTRGRIVIKGIVHRERWRHERYLDGETVCGLGFSWVAYAAKRYKIPYGRKPKNRAPVDCMVCLACT